MVKYQVTYEREKLMALKRKILYDCGEIIQHNYRGNSCSHLMHDIHFVEYKEKYVGMKDGRGEYPDEEIFEYSYNEYKDTKLVKLIDLLLEDDGSVIQQLKNPIPFEFEPSVENPQKELQQMLSLDVSEISVYELEKKFQELLKYKKYKQLNAGRKSDLEYYSEVIECLAFEEIDRISISKTSKQSPR